jgi:hypothetical protein
MEIKAGQIYKHYKGHICKVLGIALHSETHEELVVYSHPYQGHEQLWVRPGAMFKENVETEDYKGPRFEYIEG